MTPTGDVLSMHHANLVNLRSLRIDTINLGEVAEGFMSRTHPLGSVGSKLTSLSFGNVCVGPFAELSKKLSSRSMSAAARWTFFRAISRLKDLKLLALPLDCWWDLTSCGLDVAAPLQTLDGMRVVNVDVPAKAIAWVNSDRDLVMSDNLSDKTTKEELSDKTTKEEPCWFSLNRAMS